VFVTTIGRMPLFVDCC